MGLNKCRLGELIELITETNEKNLFGSNDVRGMTITKQIIPTKADVSTTDLSKFLVIHPREFVFNPRTHGKRIGFGFNDSDDSFIISWNNIGFRVIPSLLHTVLPEYLFLHFNRIEWDREACFRSWGSSTEVFSWDALCEMKIDLPPFPIQQKYVAIYKALVVNQQSYECGLEDLKLACDGYVENLCHNADLQKIGPFIAEVDTRNNLGLSVDNVVGISTSKELIGTKANMDGVSVDSYKVVAPRQITYVPDTSRRGDKMALAINDTEKPVLVSSIYTVFRTEEDYLLPDYLMLYLSRAEFDRYARFCSWGSARETFSWEEMCNVRIPIPDIGIQKAIAEVYSAYVKRKKLNEHLKSQIRDICPILIRGSVEEGGKDNHACPAAV